MRIENSGIEKISKKIEKDILEKNPKTDKRIARNIGDFVSVVLITRSVNTSEWMSILPRESKEKSKERYISRFLKSKILDATAAMSGYLKKYINDSKSKHVILMMDQTQIVEDRQCLVITVRQEKRAFPLVWKVVETKGAIGYEIQEELLEKVKGMVTEDIKITLYADRFYGTKSLVEWCKKAGWEYKIRLKGNLIFESGDKKFKAEEVRNFCETMAIDVKFNDSEIKTNIGYLQEKKHKEAWIIAMSDKPIKENILDYGKRWGCECCFSDMKSRGIEICKTHIKDIRRLENLILILAIAMLWSNFIGNNLQNFEELSFSKKEI
jgi:hypothetical protein